MSNVIQIQEQKTGFDLQPANLTEAMSLATMIAGSQLAPKAFANKPEDTLVAMMMGKEVGLNPMQAIQNIAVVNGRPSIWGDAMLALVQNHPKFVSINETFDEPTMTAICTVIRKGGQPHTQTYSQADAQTAKLWNKNTWAQYPKRMLAMRARGFALRNQFADALLGLITREEAQDTPINNEYVEPIKQINEAPKVEQLPVYPDDQFAKNLPKWTELMQAGTKTASDIINMIATKYALSEDQIKQINEA